MNSQKTKHFKKFVQNYYQFWWLLFLPFLKKLLSILNKKMYFVISFNLFSHNYLWQPESYSKNRPVLWLVEFLTILTITMIKIAVNNKQTNMIIGTFKPLSSLTDSSVSTVSLDYYWFSRFYLQWETVWYCTRYDMQPAVLWDCRGPSEDVIARKET